VEIVGLLVSPVHRYEGRPADGPAPTENSDVAERIEIRRDLGIVGDRYFAHPAHRNASVTLMSWENLPFDIDRTVDLRQTRRNVLLRGVDIDAHIGSIVVLDSGHGPVTLELNRAARPCAWMDTTIGPGARRAMRDKGGVRCRPLSDGILTLGPATLVVARSGKAPSAIRAR
jgi:hypothetical protein